MSDDELTSDGELPKISVGNVGLDDILGGGIDPERMYLFEGQPGSGKTTLALEFLLEGVRRGDPALYITLSETEREITICLPRGPAELVSEDSPASRAGTGTVLLVEDNPDVAAASTGLLEQLGYKVRWASDAAAALAELEKDGIDIVFSDIVMPGKMDGVRLAREIRAIRPKLPILLMTGYSATAKEIGSQFPVLRKPYQLHELSRELAKLTP